MHKYTLDWTENRFIRMYSVIAGGRSTFSEVIFQCVDKGTSSLAIWFVYFSHRPWLIRRCRSHHHHRPDRNLKTTTSLIICSSSPSCQSYCCCYLFVFPSLVSSSFPSFFLLFSSCFLLDISDHPCQQDFSFSSLLLTVSISRIWHNSLWPVPFLSSVLPLISWFFKKDM